MRRRRSSVPGHSVGAAVGGGDADGQRAPRLLHHLQHLHLRLQLQAVAALALHQGGARPLHPLQPPAQGGQQLGGAGRAGVLHREVNPSARPVHVHVGGAGELQRQTLKEVTSPNKLKDITLKMKYLWQTGRREKHAVEE